MPERPKLPKYPIEDEADARTHVDYARAMYRAEKASYRGRRRHNEAQQMIGEIGTDEAQEMIDGTMIGVLALLGYDNPDEVTIAEHEDTELIGGKRWKDKRSAYQHVVVDIGILTERLKEKGHPVHSPLDFTHSESNRVNSVLLNDFLGHNRLRFGTDSAFPPVKVKTTQRRYDEEEGKYVEDEVEVVRQRDIATTPRELARNIRERGFEVPGSVGPAAKLSPDQLKAIRRAYPDKDKDLFDRDASFFTDLAGSYEDQE